MFVKRLHHILIALALLAMMGQSVSAAMLPCDMGSMDTMSGSDMGAMDHADELSNFNNNQSGCCDNTSGDCSMGGCVAVSFTAECRLPAEQRFTSQQIVLYSLAVANPFSDSPYRPPISR